MSRCQKELWFGCWNLSLFVGEIMRDAGHYSTGEYAGLGKGTPIASEGIRGFVDQHIGDTVETLELFYLSRIPVHLVARGIEIMTDKKIDPRIKVGTSLLLSVSAVSALELTGHGGSVSEPLDVVGAVFAGIWGAVGYQVIDQLFKPRETPLFEQWWNKMYRLANSVKGIDKKLLDRLNTWAYGSSSQVPLPDDLAVVPAPDISGDNI